MGRYGFIFLGVVVLMIVMTYSALIIASKTDEKVTGKARREQEFFPSSTQLLFEISEEFEDDTLEKW